MDFNQKQSDVMEEIRGLQASISGLCFHNSYQAISKRARGGFEYLAVEVPSYPEQKDRLIGCLEELNRIGIDQLNLQELLVTNANVNRLEGEGYEIGLLFFKKFFLYGSRRMTYEVMQHCIENKYSFTVNDCSASKFGRRPS